jgi:hypothetical protein
VSNGQFSQTNIFHELVAAACTCGILQSVARAQAMETIMLPRRATFTTLDIGLKMAKHLQTTTTSVKINRNTQLRHALQWFSVNVQSTVQNITQQQSSELCLRSEDSFVITCVANLMEVKVLYIQQDLWYEISRYW